MRWTNTYRCGASTAPRTNTVVLDGPYTTATDVISATQCVSPADNPTCTVAENVAGVRTYTCMSHQSNCAALQSQGCTLSTSNCISPAGGTANNCMLYEKSYSCTTAGGTSTVLDCGSQQYCTGGNCFNTGHEPDADMVLAVSAQEIGRQAMTYMDSNNRLFSGIAESCDQDSLSRCCDSKGGAVKNSSIGGKILTTAGGQAIKAGSAYMYDIMSNTYNAMRGGEAMMAAASTAAASGFSMSAYGLSMTYSASAGFSFAFDPTSFAVAVAVLVVVELTSCEQSEKELAQKNGAGLCRQYGSACNGFFCSSVTRSYCCFNSKLAKIINTAAISQLGRANSDCSGLTMEEFGRMNFAAIDLSEFTAEIMSTVTLPSTGAINTDVNSGIQQKLQNYYTRGKQ
ncbi:MAG: conjugal transfer protein TraN [Sideroxyarcus sp.]|nr:conjugal transfer protein TraN [Sideroxyarcus sp.]